MTTYTVEHYNMVRGEIGGEDPSVAFDSLEEARAYFSGCDPHRDWETELGVDWASARNKTYVYNLIAWPDDDTLGETIDSKQYPDQ